MTVLLQLLLEHARVSETAIVLFSPRPLSRCCYRVVDYFAVMVSTEVNLPEGVDPDVVAAVSGSNHNYAFDSRGANHRVQHITSAAAAAAAAAAATGDGATTTTGSDASASVLDDSTLLEEAGRGVLRRVGKLQYRYPKHDHADCPMPESVDWFIFPNGIAPIAQRAASQSRPPTRKSEFVLSNVGGGALNSKMFGCCLTAYRKEAEEEADGDDFDEEEGEGVDENGFVIVNKGGARRGGNTTLWWPVVLFLLSRYPIVPQLQLM